MWAIVSHYLWLVAFCWNTLIATNFFISFVLRPLQRCEDREDSSLYRYILPASGWGLPFIIIVICLHFHIYGIKGFEYGSSTPCWISNPVANLVAFGIPVAVLLTCNVIFFVSTLTSICRSGRAVQQAGRNVVKEDVILGIKVGYIQENLIHV